MKRNSTDPLLAAVLSPDESFRAATLRETLALATRRRRWRTTRRALGVAVVVCAAVLWLRAPSRPDVEKPAIAASVEPAPAQGLRIVHTQGTAVHESHEHAGSGAHGGEPSRRGRRDRDGRSTSRSGLPHGSPALRRVSRSACRAHRARHTGSARGVLLKGFGIHPSSPGRSAHRGAHRAIFDGHGAQCRGARRSSPCSRAS